MVSTKSSKKVPVKISVPRASSVSRVQPSTAPDNHSSSYQSPLYPASSSNFSLPAHVNEAVVSASPKAGKHHFLIALIFILTVVGLSLFLFFAKNIGTGQAYHSVPNTIGLVPVDDPANVGAKSFDLTVNLGQIETVAFHFELALPAGVNCNRVIVSSFGNLADLEDKVCNGQTLSYDVAVADYSLAKTGDTSLAFLIIPNPAAGTYVLAPTNVDVIDLNTGGSVALTVESFDLVIAGQALPPAACQDDLQCVGQSEGEPFCIGQSASFTCNRGGDGCLDATSDLCSQRNTQCVQHAGLCADDLDNDAVLDVNDNCPDDANVDQNDVDEDGLGDACDVNPNDGPVGDSDGDGVINEEDICPDDANPDQDNICDRDDNRLPGDSDGDNIIDVNDNCPAVANVGQLNTDGDAQGDVCDGDDDGDEVSDAQDVCPLDETNVCDDLNQDDADPQEAVACQENGCGVEGQYICAQINGVAISQRCLNFDGCLSLSGQACDQGDELICVADGRRCIANDPVNPDVDNTGEEGAVCAVTNDCNEPLTCVAGVCGVAPVDLNGPGDGINPLDDNVPGDNPPLNDNDLYDVNLDQCIGLKDMSILGANLDIAHIGEQKVFAQGDLNADGFVDLIDVFLLTRHINWECEEQ